MPGPILAQPYSHLVEGNKTTLGIEYMPDTIPVCYSHTGLFSFFPLTDQVQSSRAENKEQLQVGY